MDAVKGGLRLLSALTAQVEGEEAQGRRRLWPSSWNLNVLGPEKETVVFKTQNHAAVLTVIHDSSTSLLSKGQKLQEQKNRRFSKTLQTIKLLKVPTNV